MNRIFILIIFIISFSDSFGQFNCLDTTRFDLNKQKFHNFVGLVPSNARVTNGWAIGWSTSVDDYCAYMTPIQINGLYTNISPLQIIVATMGVSMGIVSLFMPETYKNNSPDTTSYDKITITHKLNGVSVGLFEQGEEFSVQGLQLTGLGHKMLKLNGVSLSVIASEYKHFNGLMISGIFNKTYKGKGVQIGLFNKTKRINGIQIGLWNKIGKRGLPLINMSFKKEKQVPE